MKAKIDQLRLIANDPSMSDALRDAARTQLAELEPEPLALQEPQNSTKPPTRDFIDYVLEPFWNRLLEPKPKFERWLDNADCRERVRKHDAAVSESVQREREREGDPDIVEWLVGLAGLEYSWRWERPTWGMAIPELKGQGCDS